MSIAKLHAKLIALDVEIAETLVQHASIADKIEARQLVRTAIEGDIALAQADADALNPIPETLLTQEALGENVAEELEAARAAVTAASKRVIGARKREAEARDLSLAENGLQRHLGAFDDRLGALRSEHDDVRIDYIRGVAAEKAEDYRLAAIKLADEWAEVLAVSDHLVNIVKKDPGIMAPQSLRICLPGFAGQTEHFLSAGAFPQIKADALQRVRNELEQAGVL